MFSKCVLLALLATTAWARSTTNPANDNIIQHEEARAEDASASYLGDFKFMYKVYQECAATDLTSCLKLKLIAAMDRAARSFAQVPIFDGVSFVKEANAEATPDSAVVSEADLEAQLPRSLEERDSALNNLIFKKIGSFLETHTLQVKLPTPSDLARSFNGEERGRRRKKMSGMLLIPLILAGTMVPLALGALALLAGKALIVSKLALVLAGIIGIKKLLGGGGSHESGHEVVVSGGHGSGWGRNYKEEAAQNMAYSAYAPKTAS